MGGWKGKEKDLAFIYLCMYCLIFHKHYYPFPLIQSSLFSSAIIFQVCFLLLYFKSTGWKLLLLSDLMETPTVTKFKQQ